MQIFFRIFLIIAVFTKKKMGHFINSCLLPWTNYQSSVSSSHVWEDWHVWWNQPSKILLKPLFDSRNLVRFIHESLVCLHVAMFILSALNSGRLYTPSIYSFLLCLKFFFLYIYSFFLYSILYDYIQRSCSLFLTSPFLFRRSGGERIFIFRVKEILLN